MEEPDKQALCIRTEVSSDSSSTSARGTWAEIAFTRYQHLKVVTEFWISEFLRDENSISKINSEVNRHKIVGFRPFPLFFFLHFSAALKSRSSVKSFDQQLSFHLFVPMKKKEGGRRWQNQMKKSSQMFVFKHAEASFSPFSVYFWASDKILCAPGSETAFVTRRAILKALYSWFSVSILNYQWESNIFSVELILTWPQAYNVRRAGN